jgi:hypothetical protein
VKIVVGFIDQNDRALSWRICWFLDWRMKHRIRDLLGANWCRSDQQKQRQSNAHRGEKP